MDSLSILLALTFQKRCQSPKSTNGFQRYGKCTQMTPEVFLFFINLSKKVKCHLFCINLDTGYLLYVIVWIPVAFSLLSHHSRVVFTISNVSFWTDTIIYIVLLCSIWIYFKIKKIDIESDSSTSNSQVYHCFEKKDY